MIERTIWARLESGQLAHDTGGKTKVKRTLASWLHQALCKCRNDFVYGNFVERNDHFSAYVAADDLWICRASLPYRADGFSPFRCEVPIPSAKDARAFGAYIADRTDLMRMQESKEEAARRPPVDRAAQRVRVPRHTPAWRRQPVSAMTAQGCLIDVSLPASVVHMWTLASIIAYSVLYVDP